MHLHPKKIPNRHLVRIPALLGLVLSATLFEAAAQEPRARVRLSISSASEVRIEVDSPEDRQSWSFRNSYARALGLGSRVERFEATNGSSVRVKRMGPGEFHAEEGIKSYRYYVSLKVTEPGSMSHVSWLSNDHGFLMFADLLPQGLGDAAPPGKGLLAEFELPAGWTLYSAITPEGNRYTVLDPDRAVFFVGRSLRKVGKNVAGMQLDVVAAGAWPASEAKVLATAAKVLKKYSSLTGFQLREKAVVMLAPFPVSSGASEWKAETRGSTVILLLDPRARFVTWIGQLGVIFTHEIFHLWIPNSLRLEGDYDWFFEGFTLYVAMLTALELKLISFQEYLNTLARVYDSYLSYSDNLSLLEASERRWTSSAPIVYDKGMLVAFMYDLIVRQESRGRRTLASCYQSLFRSQAGGQASANEVIMSMLSSTPATKDFPQTYLESRGVLKLEQFLSKYGFRLDSGGSQSHLTINRDLTEEQEKLLRSLGYKR